MKITMETIVPTVIRNPSLLDRPVEEELRDIQNEFGIRLLNGTIQLNFAGDERFLGTYRALEPSVMEDGEVDQEKFKSILGVELISLEDLNEEEIATYNIFLEAYDAGIAEATSVSDSPIISSYDIG